jgi:ATP-binding cassette subfamily F protein 3
MSILRLSGVVRAAGSFVILDGVTASVAVGDRIGLVGPNGAGKTTLLRIASGADEPDGGTVERKRGITIGLLAQESHLDPAFMAAVDLRTAVRHGASHLERMAAQLTALEGAGRVTEAVYAELQHEFEVLGGYTLDHRVDEALSGLGFGRSAWTQPPASLSGGEQTRAALARLIVASPDLLLLDEPTNHLDVAALEWLEEHLRRRTGAVVVASHDRTFLDATVIRIWELRDRRLTAFRGGYSAYHRQRLERDRRTEREAGAQAAAIARERELVGRYRSQRKHTKMHEHEARLERLEAERTQAPREARRLKLPMRALAGDGLGRSSEVALRAEDLVVGYLPGRGPSEAASARPVLRAPFLAAQRGERIGVVGPNGAGKTTLLRTLAGELPPLDGTVTLGQGVQIGYLAQLREAALPGATVLEALLHAYPTTQGEARGYLARFLFRGEDVHKEVRLLSGGERSRLELAILGVLSSNLLLLDEPTNHLDIPAREAIESFFLESAATIIVVSHDRRLLDTVCGRLWVVDDGLAVPFEGTYRGWRAAVAEGWTAVAAAERVGARLRLPAGPAGDAAGDRRQAPAAAGGSSPKRPATSSARGPVATVPRRTAARRDRLSKDAYRRQKAAVEAELTRLGLRRSHLELALGDPGVQANFVEMRRLSSELADVEAALQAAEERWLEVEEQAP